MHTTHQQWQRTPRVDALQQRSDKYPDEWREFVISHWKSPTVTRQSEKARDNYISKEHFGQKVTTMPKRV